MPPTHSPRRFEAAILSRMRSEVTSRSNWAKDRSTFRVSRPMLEVVLNACVTRHERDLTGIEQLDQLGKVGKRAGQAIDLVDDDHVDRSGLNVREEPLQGRAVHRPARDAAVVVSGRDQGPALMGLALDIGLGGL